MHLVRGFLPLTDANITIKSEMLSDGDDISSGIARFSSSYG